jgi:hypothetical protein
LLDAGPQRGGSNLAALARVAGVLVPAPHHRVTSQVVTLGVLVVGCRVEGRIGDRIEQQLQPNVRLPKVQPDLLSPSRRFASSRENSTTTSKGL